MVLGYVGELVAQDQGPSCQAYICIAKGERRVFGSSFGEVLILPVSQPPIPHTELLYMSVGLELARG